MAPCLRHGSENLSANLVPPMLAKGLIQCKYRAFFKTAFFQEPMERCIHSAIAVQLLAPTVLKYVSRFRWSFECIICVNICAIPNFVAASIHLRPGPRAKHMVLNGISILSVSHYAHSPFRVSVDVFLSNSALVPGR